MHFYRNTLFPKGKTADGALTMHRTSTNSLGMKTFKIPIPGWNLAPQDLERIKDEFAIGRSLRIGSLMRFLVLLRLSGFYFFDNVKSALSYAAAAHVKASASYPLVYEERETLLSGEALAEFASPENEEQRAKDILYAYVQMAGAEFYQREGLIENSYSDYVGKSLYRYFSSPLVGAEKMKLGGGNPNALANIFALFLDQVSQPEGALFLEETFGVPPLKAQVLSKEAQAIARKSVVSAKGVIRSPFFQARYSDKRMELSGVLSSWVTNYTKRLTELEEALSLEKKPATAEGKKNKEKRDYFASMEAHKALTEEDDDRLQSLLKDFEEERERVLESRKEALETTQALMGRHGAFFKSESLEKFNVLLAALRDLNTAANSLAQHFPHEEEKGELKIKKADFSKKIPETKHWGEIISLEDNARKREEEFALLHAICAEFRAQQTFSGFKEGDFPDGKGDDPKDNMSRYVLHRALRLRSYLAPDGEARRRLDGALERALSPAFFQEIKEYIFKKDQGRVWVSKRGRYDHQLLGLGESLPSADDLYLRLEALLKELSDLSGSNLKALTDYIDLERLTLSLSLMACKTQTLKLADSPAWHSEFMHLSKTQEGILKAGEGTGDKLSTLFNVVYGRRLGILKELNRQRVFSRYVFSFVGFRSGWKAEIGKKHVKVTANSLPQIQSALKGSEKKLQLFFSVLKKDYKLSVPPRFQGVIEKALLFNQGSSVFSEPNLIFEAVFTVEGKALDTSHFSCHYQMEETRTVLAQPIVELYNPREIGRIHSAGQISGAQSLIAFDLGLYGIAFAVYHLYGEKAGQLAFRGKTERNAGKSRKKAIGYIPLDEVKMLKARVARFRKEEQPEGKFSAIDTPLKNMRDTSTGHIVGLILSYMHKYNAFPVFENNVGNLQGGSKMLETIYQSIIDTFFYSGVDARNNHRNWYFSKSEAAAVLPGYRHVKDAFHKTKEKQKVKIHPGITVRGADTSQRCSICKAHIQGDLDATFSAEKRITLGSEGREFIFKDALTGKERCYKWERPFSTTPIESKEGLKKLKKFLKDQQRGEKSRDKGKEMSKRKESTHGRFFCFNTACRIYGKKDGIQADVNGAINIGRNFFAEHIAEDSVKVDSNRS